MNVAGEFRPPGGTDSDLLLSFAGEGNRPGRAHAIPLIGMLALELSREEQAMVTETAPGVGAPRRRWVPMTALVLSVLGLLVSGYMTLSHYTDQAVLVCSTNSVIDCARVTSSPQSQLLGIPVAVLGVVFFVAMCVLNLPAMWRSANSTVRLARFASVGIGIVFVAYLVAVELLILHVICEWCTVVHILTIALFVVTVLGEMGRSGRA